MRTDPPEAVFVTIFRVRCLACRSWGVLSITAVFLLFLPWGIVWGQRFPERTDESDGDLARIVTATSREDATRQARQLDPRNDGWETEAFSSQASQQLKHLGDLLTSDEPITDERLSDIVNTRALVCSRLIP